MMGVELDWKTRGIIGLRRIRREVAVHMQTFGTKVTAVTPEQYVLTICNGWNFPEVYIYIVVGVVVVLVVVIVVVLVVVVVE